MVSIESFNVLTIIIIVAFIDENANASKYILHIACNQKWNVLN